MIKVITALVALGILVVVILADLGKLPALLKMVWLIPYGDKAAHFLLLGGLAFLANLSWKNAVWTWKGVRFLKGTVVVATVVTLEEISQAFVPERTFSWGDLGADFVGIALATYLAWRFFPSESSEDVSRDKISEV